VTEAGGGPRPDPAADDLSHLRTAAGDRIDPASQQAADDRHERWSHQTLKALSPGAMNRTSRLSFFGALFVTAPPEGTTVPHLMTATGMSRPWIYLRLRDLAASLDDHAA
jgi:hypothetical protein